MPRAAALARARASSTVATDARRRRRALRRASRAPSRVDDDADAFATLDYARRRDEALDAYVARVVEARAPRASDVGAMIVASARAGIERGRARRGEAVSREARMAAAKARGDAATAFNAAISAYNRMGMSESCVALMEMMRDALDVAPDVVTYALCASALTREGRLRDAEATLERASEALRRGTRPNRKQKKRAKNDDEWSMVVLRDSDGIAAVVKPAGVLTHPVEGGGSELTLMDAALSRFDGQLSDLNGLDKRGIVSRLDKPTSGVVLLAKNNASHAELLTQFYQRCVVKQYCALLDGTLPASGSESTPLDGRSATSEYEVMETFIGPSWSYSLVRVEPKSGRKHQIRRHMALLGAPLVGDPLYRTARTKQINPNPPECVLKALSVGKPGTIFWLHASAVEYSGMPNGERIVVSAPLPSAFETLLASLRAGARDE